VFEAVEELRLGLVASVAHPGGNFTGVNLSDAVFYAKRLQILKEAVAPASTIAWLTIGGRGKVPTDRHFGQPFRKQAGS
jgi:hypothetical protein